MVENLFYGGNGVKSYAIINNYIHFVLQERLGLKILTKTNLSSHYFEKQTIKNIW